MIGLGRYRRPFRWSSSPRAENQEMPFGCFLMVLIPVLFVVSTYFAWWELRYAVQGATAEGAVVEVREVTRGRRLARRQYLAVRYTFEDASTGRRRTERDDVPISWHPPAGKVPVQYVPGKAGASRLAGYRNHFSVIFFVVCVGAVIVYGALLVREAQGAERDRKKAESRRRRDGR